jgi:hypothetical protein
MTVAISSRVGPERRRTLTPSVASDGPSYAPVQMRGVTPAKFLSRGWDTARVVPAGLRSDRHRKPGVTLPLAALRGSLDRPGDDAGWAMSPDGTIGRALLVGAGARYTASLTLSGEVQLR